MLGLPWRQHRDGARHSTCHGLQWWLAGTGGSSSFAHIVARDGTTAQIVWLWNVTHCSRMQVHHAALTVQTGLALRARTLGGHIAFPKGVVKVAELVGVQLG